MLSNSKHSKTEIVVFKLEAIMKELLTSLCSSDKKIATCFLPYFLFLFLKIQQAAILMPFLHNLPTDEAWLTEPT